MALAVEAVELIDDRHFGIATQQRLDVEAVVRGGRGGSAEQLEAGQLACRNARVDGGDNDVGAARPTPARLVERGRGRTRAIGVTEIDSDVRTPPTGARLRTKQVLGKAALRLDAGGRPRLLGGDDVQVNVGE